MPQTELWSTLVSAIDPSNLQPMPAVLKSTIDLLESELVKARSALQEIQPQQSTSSSTNTNTTAAAVASTPPPPMRLLRDEVTVGAMAVHRKNLIGRAPDFFYYGATRLTQRDLGLVPSVYYNDLPPSNNHNYDYDFDAWLEQEHYVPPPPLSVPSRRRTNFLDIFSNSLILDHMAPYLPVSSLLSLAATSKSLRFTVMETPYVFRHLDLTRCRGAQLFPFDTSNTSSVSTTTTRNEHLDDDDWLTEDEYYSAPLKSIFANLQRKSILQDVRTLVLDGLSVPADLVSEIILNDRFHVSILSIRDCLHLNERKLMQVLQHAVRPTRPKGTPTVKGIYFFTPKESTGFSNSLGTGSSSSSRVQNDWYRPSGKLLKGAIETGWAQTLRKCEGIISFDAVLCQGARHNIELFTPANKDRPRPGGKFLGPTIATVALGPEGCGGCHKLPENMATWGQSAHEHFPLLTPPPLHSSTITAAKRPVLFSHEGEYHPALAARCTECIADRWCHQCNKWFCFSCLPHPDRARASLSPHQTAVRARHGNQNGHAASHEEQRKLMLGVSKDCWECGPTCASCKLNCQRVCRSCRGDYCIEHNDGCSTTMCDWCNTCPRRRLRD